MKKIAVVVLGLIKKDNKYLLTLRCDSNPKEKETYNKWQIPGGELDFGEIPEQTLTREIKEELGIEIEILALVPKVYTKIHKDHWQGIFIIYLCRMKNLQGIIKLNEESSKYSWFTLNEIKKLNTIIGTEEIIQKVEKIGET